MCSRVFLKICSSCFVFSALFLSLKIKCFFLCSGGGRRARVPLPLQVESRVPEAILVFVIPATICVKVGGLVAAATNAVFFRNFINGRSHFEKVDLQINESFPSIWLKTG